MWKGVARFGFQGHASRTDIYHFEHITHHLPYIGYSTSHDTVEPWRSRLAYLSTKGATRHTARDKPVRGL